MTPTIPRVLTWCPTEKLLFVWYEVPPSHDLHKTQLELLSALKTTFSPWCLHSPKSPLLSQAAVCQSPRSAKSALVLPWQKFEGRIVTPHKDGILDEIHR
ncbi:hypothetical protein K435DRAFT_965663 [Dendrothele bispora CBS 962.96]|uniref:Uncharacterized protein n=1 Tax=Dendrothele bispora (strain CBS 962.96) TaxID=1314807 RepID=A0A4S8M5K1_DENBC|nr:hypothetical protein K435DRAFT_965663 [Dendrothele bispora CBS 962.96]